MHRIPASLNAITTLVGRLTAWLTLAMVLITFAVVLLRYAFGVGWIWLQETVILLHAAIFMLAAAWTLHRGDHVRVDVFYRRASAHRRAWVDILGTILFLLPFCLFILWSSWDYVLNSFNIREMSREAGGLRYPWPSLQKSLILAMAGLLLLQGVSLLISSILRLRTPDEAAEEDGLPGL